MSTLSKANDNFRSDKQGLSAGVKARPGRPSSKARATARSAGREKPTRLQWNASPGTLRALDELLKQSGLRTRPALLESVFLPIVQKLYDAVEHGEVVMLVKKEDTYTVKGREIIIPTAALAEPEYQFLVRREHRWHKQLYLKGRNMPAGLLVRHMMVEHQTPEEAAEDSDLPVEAVREAVAYYGRHKDLIEAEFAEERLWLKKKGYPVEL